MSTFISERVGHTISDFLSPTRQFLQVSNCLASIWFRPNYCNHHQNIFLPTASSQQSLRMSNHPGLSFNRNSIKVHVTLKILIQPISTYDSQHFNNFYDIHQDTNLENYYSVYKAEASIHSPHRISPPARPGRKFHPPGHWIEEQTLREKNRLLWIYSYNHPRESRIKDLLEYEHPHRACCRS